MQICISDSDSCVLIKNISCKIDVPPLVYSAEFGKWQLKQNIIRYPKKSEFFFIACLFGNLLSQQVPKYVGT